MTTSRGRTAILTLFFVSGAASLVYQVVWVRMLVLVFGTSAFAISTVLCAFMAGLALGSALFGRLADRRRDNLRIYACLEAGIGVFALVFPFLLTGLDDLYTLLYRHLGSTGYAFALVRFPLCFLVLLVPTTLMGATLPVLSKWAIRRRERIAAEMGGLYAVNTLGAATGVMLTAFVLLEYLGVTATTWLAAALNLLIAGIALWWHRRETAAHTPDAEPATVPQGAEPTAEAPINPVVEAPAGLALWIVFGGFAASGFAALGYEVLWTRLLSMLLQSATAQSLSTILVAFLLGLAGGGAVGARYADRWRDLPTVFGVVEILIGLCGLASILVFGSIPYLFQAFASYGSWEAHMAKLFVAAFGVMLVPTFLMGLLFPVVGRLWARRLEHVGQRVGDVYAVNTLGAVLGAFAAGFVLLPTLGTQASIQTMAWINIAVGALVLFSNPLWSRRRKLVSGGLMAATIAILTSLPPSNLVRELAQWTEPNSRLLFFDEDTAGTVTVHEYPDGRRLLKVNGGGEVPTNFASIQTFRLLGNLPMVLHPDPRHVAVIAFGGGITLSSAELHDPERLDCIEVVPGVVEGAAHFARYNYHIFDRLDRPHLELILEDGRNHILRTDRRYDVLIGDATHPGTADSWVLYTEEFYRLCQQRLREGGVVAQWLPLHGLSTQDYRMILRTFQTVFPHATLWLTHDYSIMLGTPAPLRIDLPRLRERLANEAVGANLLSVDLGDPVSFLSALALGGTEFSRFVGTGSINTDDRPYVSFTDRRRGGTGGGRPALVELSTHLAVSALPYVKGGDDPTRASLERRFAARRHTVDGLVARLARDGGTATKAYRRALEIDPGERGAARALGRR